MIEFIVFIITVLFMLAVVYLIEVEPHNRCPKCGGQLFRWSRERLDCRNCSYKEY
jgi:ribosomal protein S27AE